MWHDGKKGVAFGLAMLYLWRTPDILAQGCAMCGTVGTTDALAAGAFNWSILFMVAIPYILFGSIAGWIVYKHRAYGQVGRRQAVGSKHFNQQITKSPNWGGWWADGQKEGEASESRHRF